MDDKSIELYKQALSEGKEAVHNIRVMIVGPFGAGKTTLKKRLFGESVDISKRESTDGIDVHVKRCKVSLDTGQWNMVDKDQTTDVAHACHRLVKLLKKPNITGRSADIKTVPSLEKIQLCNDSCFTCGEKNNLSSDGQTHDSVTGKAEIGSNDFNPGETNITEEKTQHIKTEEPNEEYIRHYLNELVSESKKHNVSNAESDSADLSIWDFAGQFAFYGTHQVFLSKRAVYLLVTDISKHAQDVIEDDDCFVDSRGPKLWKISEILDFWLSSIHEFCSSLDDEGPPVILVGTFADKLDAETKKDTVDQFFYKLRCTLVDKPTRCHLTDEDFVLDNSVVDSNLERLKKKIFEAASKQNYWGEVIPAKWITLERLLASLKEKGHKVLTKDQLRDQNGTLPVPIETENELELFLRFHHESGNMLYFSEEKLQDSFILDPQWLVDAFKSLITAKMFCSRKLTTLKEWRQFDNSAILTNNLVDTIWGKEENAAFHEHKYLVLNYLERLGIIAKPFQQPNFGELTDDYFAPCVLKTSPPEDVLHCSNFENRRSTTTLCFKTPSGFLPTAVFNKLLAACIRRWRPSKRHGKPTIFCGCGIFDLHENHKLYIYFYDSVIQIRLTKLSTTDQEPDSNLCLQVKDFVLDLLRNKCCMTSSIDIYVKCQTTALHSCENMFGFDDIAEKNEVTCSCIQEQHAVRVYDLLKYWRVDWIPETSMNMSREVTETDLSKISQAIGSGWQILGATLGITQVEMEHIDNDNKTTPLKIFSMLGKWRSQNDATVNTLYNAIKNCKTGVTFDMKVIERVFAQSN